MTDTDRNAQRLEAGRKGQRVSATRAAEKRAARAAEKRAALIDEIEFLLSIGESARSIPGRLGYANAESLVRRLYRADRHDLAQLLYVRQTPRRREAGRARRLRLRRPCLAGCGGTCGHDAKHQICHACNQRLGLSRALGITGDLVAALRLKGVAE